MTDWQSGLLYACGLGCLVLLLRPVSRARWRLLGFAGLCVALGLLPRETRTTLLQQLLNGIFLGSIYALIALGYTLVYGVLKLINFAHGEIFMTGAFVGYFTLTALEQTPLLAVAMALLLAMIVCAGLGVTIERVAYRPLREAPRLAALITAIGVSLLLQNLGLVVVGASPKRMPEVMSSESFGWLKEHSGLSLNGPNLTTFLAALILMAGLQMVVSRTRIGRAMRAVSEDREAAQMMGINVDQVISVTFIIGSALAGAGGVLYGILYFSIKPDLGVLPGLKAFVAAVLGGIGSVKGAMVGGMLIGLVEVVVQATTASALDLTHWALLVLLLVASWRATQTWLAELPPGRRGRLLRAGGSVAAAAVCYWSAGVLAVLLAPLLSAAPLLPVITGSTFRDAVVFAILIVILLVKPTGLMGRYAPEKV